MSIEERVRRLETGCHRWRMAASVLSVLLVVVVCLGQTRPTDKNLDVESIRFRDEKGRTRIVIASAPPQRVPELGEPSGKDKDRFTGVLVFNEDGQTSSRLDCDSVQIFRKKDGTDETTRRSAILSPGMLAVFGAEKNGHTVMTLLDDEQLQVSNVTLNKDGCAVSDDNGVSRAILGTAKTVNAKTGAETASPPGALTIFDANGKVLVQQP